MSCPSHQSSFFFYQVDDILGEESDNESEGRGKDKPGNEEVEDEEEQQQQQRQDRQTAGGRGAGPQAMSAKETVQTPSREAGVSR